MNKSDDETFELEEQAFAMLRMAMDLPFGKERQEAMTAASKLREQATKLRGPLPREPLQHIPVALPSRGR